MGQNEIDQLMKKIKNDTRSPNEVFSSIANLLVRDCNIPTEQSHEAARKLIRVLEIGMKVAEREK
ncbi:MAG: hypothetical protein MK052_06470 [Alphaproteobacteria bacterium]|nr:hypothetical protein [Alphaproteobacteria bacterium]